MILIELKIICEAFMLLMWVCYELEVLLTLGLRSFSSYILFFTYFSLGTACCTNSTGTGTGTSRHSEVLCLGIFVA